MLKFLLSCLAELPSDKSWGKKKSMFYDADTADADVGMLLLVIMWFNVI